MREAGSPFLEIAASEWLCANALAFAIFDSFPVSPGHVLVVTRRVVPTFFECTAAEQAALMDLVGEARRLLDERLRPRPDGYNVGFNTGAAAGQTVPHVHVHVIPRYAGDMADPRGGVRHVIPQKGNYLAEQAASPASPDAAPPAAPRANDRGPRLSLTTGPAAPLWPRLADRLPGASEIDVLAAFVQPSGLDLVGKSLFGALAAGARIRLLVGDYLGITSPEALRRLLGWISFTDEKAGSPGGSGTAPPLFSNSAPSPAAPSPARVFGCLNVRLAELDTLRGAPASFHPKAWRIADTSGGIVVVGSSNLSRAALETGVEWNLVGETTGSAAIDRDLAAAFEDLWQQATPLSAAVIERYAARAEQAAELRRLWDEDGASDLPTATAGKASAAAGRDAEANGNWAVFPVPRPWQREALAALAAIRGEGYQKALVAVATGLGKTWLAAFDVIAHGDALGRPPRVLVIAHRAEILAQAEATLRRALEQPVGPARPARISPTVSYVAGAGCDFSGQLVIASIQKLSRPEGLEALAAAAPFDYCVIDEVHHAEAPSYRRVLARLPRHARSFTLGLTATPERTDGVDVATLFDDILAYQATIGDGIAEGSLVPFRYRGLKDDVDYDSSRIPWRNGRFDVAALEEALENSARMERLWAEWQAVPAGRTLVFCCSRRHALFARDWLVRRGVAAAAVISGDGGDPRMASLAAFREGGLSALCVVDLFNEGIDLPLVDRVVMLRPTESKIVFLQQLGRGLRAAEGKTRLDVIDFVGNHRVFASRLVHLLSLVPRGEGDAAAFAVLKEYLAGGEPELPAGCVLDVEVEAKELLEQFLPKGRGAVVEAYRSLRAELGRRPTPAEVFHAGYLPKVLRAEHDDWFSFCGSEGDLDATEQSVASRFKAWLNVVETTARSRSYKLVTLRVLLDHDWFWDGVDVPTLALACRDFLDNHRALKADLADADFERDPENAAAEQASFAKWWRRMPLDKWLSEQDGRRWFAVKDDRFRADFKCPPEMRACLEGLTGELVDYRLAEYTRSRQGGRQRFRAKVSHSGGKPILFLPTVEAAPSRPTGPTRVRLPDGTEWLFRFVKVACNVAHPADLTDKQNQLPALLREWFGPDAGLPGTGFEVEFSSADGAWLAVPVGTVQGTGDCTHLPVAAGDPAPAAGRGLEPNGGRHLFPGPLINSPPPASRYVTHVPVYALTAAAGLWGPESVPEEIGWTEMPGGKLKPGMFVARVRGKSMEPLIPDGSWCLFRPCPAGSREGRIVLVQLGTEGAGEYGGRFTVKKYHSEKTVTADGWRHERIQLLPVNPAFEPIALEAEDADDLLIAGELITVVASGSPATPVSLADHEGKP